jgi:chromate transporter
VVRAGGGDVDLTDAVGQHLHPLGDKAAQYRAAGALAATVGLFGGPLCVLVLLAIAHDRWGELPLVKAVLAGTAAAAAGMVIGTALKIVQNLKPTLPLVAVGLVAVAGALLRVPLPVIVLGLAPFGIGSAWWVLRARETGR